MRNLVFTPLAFLLLAAATPPIPLHGPSEWKAEAARVSIIRDDWGIAHIHGKTDADAVFGMIYAQAEDDFPRIEANYLTALGRTAEADGVKTLWQDLRARLYIGEAELKDRYWQSPQAMRRLMDAWADGLNFYLATHPAVKPRVLGRFEPWMALSFTEGSIGGDIENIDLDQLAAFYGAAKPTAKVAMAYGVPEPNGSNGIAIAPALTRSGHALLLINPHTSFYFRSELQVTSDEGLDVYGAATWGQFFIYQGFNAHAGWMHTSSGVDNVDEFAYPVRRTGGGWQYRYGGQWRAMIRRPISIRVRDSSGRVTTRTFTAWRTHRGPVVRRDGNKWIAFAMMDRPVEALQQSFLRTKASDLDSYLAVAQLRANSSNNTVFADDKGEIAMLSPQFMPNRDDRFDFSMPVDGSDIGTDWGALAPLSKLPNTVAPPNGWVQNTNTWPYRAAGPFSPDPKRFPKYLDSYGENFRGIHAQQLLTGRKGWTLETLQAAAFDPFQPGFAANIPLLIRSYDALPPTDARKSGLVAPIDALRHWDFRWSARSVPQTLASAWGAELVRTFPHPAREPGNVTMLRLARDATAEERLGALERAVATLQRDFGGWAVRWGDLNRFQRLGPAIAARYDDGQPSTAVPFALGNWGSLASFAARPRDGTKRWYGDFGNTFVAVVEFGPRVRARAVWAGGESGHLDSPHFRDQIDRYAGGNLRDVYFYPDQLTGHTERTYRPGE